MENFKQNIHDNYNSITIEKLPDTKYITCKIIFNKNCIDVALKIETYICLLVTEAWYRAVTHDWTLQWLHTEAVLNYDILIKRHTD